MKVSEAMSKAIEDFLDNMPQIAEHAELKDNPHEVTKEQVGLGNVKNEVQMTADDLSEHGQGNTYRHTAADIDYSQSQTVKERIDSLVIDGGVTI